MKKDTDDFDPIAALYDRYLRECRRRGFDPDRFGELARVLIRGGYNQKRDGTFVFSLPSKNITMTRHTTSYGMSCPKRGPRIVWRDPGEYRKLVGLHSRIEYERCCKIRREMYQNEVKPRGHKKIKGHWVYLYEASEVYAAYEAKMRRG
ncbi:MAG: hypothetical protein PHI35_07715 [Victivallaceae bacterium]|nr:hypothetical protein [Victivallaceae bacterium]